MVRIVIRCEVTGHYIFTGYDAKWASFVTNGRVWCPYCEAEHFWGNRNNIKPLQDNRSGAIIRRTF